MLSRFLALGAVIAVSIGVGRWADAGNVIEPKADVSAIALLPSSMSGYRMQSGWNHFVFGKTEREEGALYSPVPDGPARDAVQLDFFRNARETHNGISCYLVQGEGLRGEALRKVDTRGGPVLFDVAVIESGNHLRLVAATECRPDGCAETLVRKIGWSSWQRWTLRSLLSPVAGVVPFSIMIERGGIDDMQQSAAIEAQLQEEFTAIAAQLDLAPAQHLAAALN